METVTKQALEIIVPMELKHMAFTVERMYRDKPELLPECISFALKRELVLDVMDNDEVVFPAGASFSRLGVDTYQLQHALTGTLSFSMESVGSLSFRRRDLYGTFRPML